MKPDAFEATFRLRIDPEHAWRRLTDNPSNAGAGRVWLAGFDSLVTIITADAPKRFRATKDEEPCAGTDIVVTLDDDDTGTRVHVVQSGFGDWLPAHYDFMAIGWRFIVADLQAYLATGVHARRHLRRWGDLGADCTAVDGGVRIGAVRDGGLAGAIGLVEGDLLVTLGGAPVASLDDLVTVLRVTGASSEAEWIREGSLIRHEQPGPLAAPA
jgi:hypothetical protein